MVTSGDVLTGEEFSAISELPEGLEAFQIPLTGEYLIKRKGDFAGISHITEFDNPYARALFEPALGDESAMRETALAVEAHDGSLAFWMVDLGDGQYTAHSISAEFTDCMESLDLFIDHSFIHTVTYDCAERVDENGDVDRGRLFNAVLLDDKSNPQHRVN